MLTYNLRKENLQHDYFNCLFVESFQMRISDTGQVGPVFLLALSFSVVQIIGASGSGGLSCFSLCFFYIFSVLSNSCISSSLKLNSLSSRFHVRNSRCLRYDSMSRVFDFLLVVSLNEALSYGL